VVCVFLGGVVVVGVGGSKLLNLIVYFRIKFLSTGVRYIIPQWEVQIAL